MPTREIDTPEWMAKVQADARAKFSGSNGGSIGYPIDMGAQEGFNLDQNVALAAVVDARKSTKVVPM